MNRVKTIYKIHLVKYGDVDEQGSIIVFYGNDTVSTDELNSQFINDPTNSKFIDNGSGEPIFSSDELDHIKNKNIKVTFINRSIYPDDTILTIKLKVLEELNTEIAVEELFLFCSKRGTGFSSGCLQYTNSEPPSCSNQKTFRKHA